MKKISRILTTVLCCAPLSLVHAAPVATTNGSNLTAYHANNVNNNQWATISNGRYDADNNTSVKADFGNCNSIVLRCAQPKCSSGGCSDIEVAKSIVEGCVKANKSCEKYGADLVSYMSAQLVASSNAKIQEQEFALQQAKIQAEAQASAAQSEQISEMNRQMQEMQRQMLQQQQESQRQLQEALEQQKAQSDTALAEMKSAATSAAQETEAGLTSYQQEAIDRGISPDVLERQTMAGQVRTQIEDAEASMNTLKKTLQNVFEYAKCDNRGNNCEGPKRVKKWREMAKDFIDPYDNAINKVYDALEDASGLGIDLSQIYMMLDDSCKSWAQYMCPQKDGSQIIYSDVSSGQKGTPYVCSSDANIETVCSTQAAASVGSGFLDEKYDEYKKNLNLCKAEKFKSVCQPCIMLKALSSEDAVYEGWVNAEASTNDGNVTVVACSSGILDNSKFFARRARKKNGADLVDIDVLDTWLTQTEPGYKQKEKTAQSVYSDYCYAEGAESILQSAALSKIAPANSSKLCVKDLGSKSAPENKEECPYISPVYAICDTHPYNAGYDKLDGTTSSSLTEQINETKKIVGLKTTVISQQMYKQYEYLAATIRRLKIQLEKAIVKTNLEAAGADSKESSSGLLGGGFANSNSSDKKVVLAGAENCANSNSSSAAYKCLQNNISVIIANASSNRQKACKQLGYNIDWADPWGVKLSTAYTDCKTNCSKDRIVECAQALNQGIIKYVEDKEDKKNNYRGYYMPMGAAQTTPDKQGG